MKILYSFFFFFIFSFSAFAELTPEQEQRAKELYSELRCVVCQNQSIADSNADIAQDLKNLVKDEIKLGKSNNEIKNFLVSRYGEFILLKPRLSSATFILWFFPLFVFLLASGFLIYAYRKRTKQ